MRTRTLLRLFCIAAMLICGWTAQAQLPDLRGQTFFFTGTLDVNGVAFGQNFGDLAPGGLSIGRSNQSRLIIDNAGPENNSALTGGLKLPVFPDPDGTCLNPTIPLTGSFNRATGAFTMSGSISGDTVVDFGVATIPGLGERRIQVRFNNLAINITGVGGITLQGDFTIANFESDHFSFTTSASTPTLALGSTTTCDFGALQDTVTNAFLSFRDWTAAQLTVFGTVALEECPNAERPLSVLFCPAVGAPFTRIVTPTAEGNFLVQNINPGTYHIGLKATQWLRKVVLNVDGTGNNVTLPTVMLMSGDANDDNSVDVLDLDLLIQSFDTCLGDGGFDPGADFNCDDCVDVLDLDILIRNFDVAGEECP